MNLPNRSIRTGVLAILVPAVGILGALQRLERPPPLPSAPSAHALGLDCYECGDPPASWGPISDPNDHRGGPSGGVKPKPPPPPSSRSRSRPPVALEIRDGLGRRRRIQVI